MVNLFDNFNYSESDDCKDSKVDSITYKPDKDKIFGDMSLVPEIHSLSDIPLDLVSTFEAELPVRGYETNEVWSYYSKFVLVRSAIVNGIEDSDWDRFISYYVKAFGCTVEEAEESPLVNYLKGGTVDTDKIQKDYEGMT